MLLFLHKPYDGNYENRPNQGLMISLQKGIVNDIHGDKDFAAWVERHRDDLQQSFNASDKQGGMDAHWPKPDTLLNNIIKGIKTTVPGYYNLISDQTIPVSELFNYTRSRASEYQLKYGSLTSTGGGIASQYENMNKKMRYGMTRHRFSVSVNKAGRTQKSSEIIHLVTFRLLAIQEISFLAHTTVSMA